MSDKKPENSDDILAPHKIPTGGGESFLADWEERTPDKTTKTPEIKTTKISPTPEHQRIKDDYDPQF